jgi:hypothetical protein
MTLQSAIEAALPELRREAEARMTSRATIGHKSGTDTSGGLKKPSWSKSAGVPMRLGGTSDASRTVDIDGSPVTVPVRVASFPIGTALEDGWIIELTSGDNAGRFYRVVEAGGKDQATALRVQVVGTERPDGWQ